MNGSSRGAKRLFEVSILSADANDECYNKYGSDVGICITGIELDELLDSEFHEDDEMKQLKNKCIRYVNTHNLTKSQHKMISSFISICENELI